jgi:hypothetical protein
MAVWILRELASAPVMIRRMDRATGIGLVEQMAGARMPLLASAVMASALLVVRHWLPTDLGAATRVAILLPAGAATFLLTLWACAPQTLRGLVSFITSGAASATEPVVQPP